MKSAVTLCRVAEAAAGPFVFHGPLEVGFEKAAALGFDAVELFLGGPDEVPVAEIKALQEKHGLAIAAVEFVVRIVRALRAGIGTPEPGS